MLICTLYVYIDIQYTVYIYINQLPIAPALKKSILFFLLHLRTFSLSDNFSQLPITITNEMQRRDVTYMTMKKASVFSISISACGKASLIANANPITVSIRAIIPEATLDNLDPPAECLK